MSHRSMVALSNLSFSYNGSRRTVFENLSLQIPTGQVTAILGPNGSGKTTLLRLLLGVLRPISGTVLLAGRPDSHYTRQERGQLIGLVPQDEHIPFDFSVLEYVLLGRAPYLGPLEMPGTLDHQVAQEALETVGLSTHVRRALPNLSGGERQLAIVARALAQQPQILLMDEPTAHLDLGNKERILGIMRAQVEAGVTVILTTHDPNLAATVAGHAILMNQGRVLAAGPTKSVLTAPQLSETYNVPVKVFEVDERRLILL